jgi:hypothetical protein
MAALSAAASTFAPFAPIASVGKNNLEQRQLHTKKAKVLLF